MNRPTSDRLARIGRAPAAVLLAGALAGLALPLAAQAPPSTDVWVAPLLVKDGAVSIGELRNASDRPGYDNQPAFSSDGKGLWFTSGRSGGQTDIYRYDLKRRETARVTDSPESEYSATAMPGGGGFSAIVVERDSTQRLWRIDPSDGKRTVLLADVKPVGYHAWSADGKQVLVFLLGNAAKSQPNVVALADIRTGRVDTLGTSPGRVLARHPVTGALTWSERAAGATAIRVRGVDPRTKQLTELGAGLDAKSQDYAWSPSGRLFMADGSVLWQRTANGPWTTVTRISDPRLGAITRLAISPKGDFIALVAEEPTGTLPVAQAPATLLPVQTAPSTADRLGDTRTPAPAPSNPTKGWTDLTVPGDSAKAANPPKPWTDLTVPGDSAKAAANPPKPWTDVAVPAGAPAPTPRPSRSATTRPSGGAAMSLPTPAQTLTIIVVRHAEKATGTGDVPLSDAGRVRAAALAAALEDADVRQVITTPLTRTKQTAAPLAAALGLVPVEVGFDGGFEMHARAVAERAVRAGGGAVLVVGHSNTVPAILAALGAPRLPDLCESVYDGLYVLTVPPAGTRTLVRATYGAPTPGDASCAGMRP